MSREYRGERKGAGQLVYDPDGDLLDKLLDVVRIAPGGFDWGEDGDDEKPLQLAVALLADHVNDDVAREYHHGFAQYLAETLAGDEWTLQQSEIRETNWTRPTEFENRADLESDPLADVDAATETAPADADEPAEDQSADEGSARDGDTSKALTTAAAEAVDAALETTREDPDVAVTDDGWPSEALLGALTTEVAIRSVEDQLDRSRLDQAARDYLRHRLDDGNIKDCSDADTGGESDLSPASTDEPSSAADAFDWLSDDQLETAT